MVVLGRKNRDDGGNKQEKNSFSILVSARTITTSDLFQPSLLLVAITTSSFHHKFDGYSVKHPIRQLRCMYAI